MTRFAVIACTLILLAGFFSLPVFADIPLCPTTYSSCQDVPGKSCRLGTGGLCSTTETNDHRCEEPDGSIFVCPPGQKIQIQACPCRTRLQLICCPDCEEFTCESCESQPGSQIFFCG